MTRTITLEFVPALVDLTEREFDTIDAIHTIGNAEHTLSEIAARMNVSYDCIEKRIERMRKRGLMTIRTIEAEGRQKRHILVRVSDLGETSFQHTYDEMAVAS